MSTIKIIFNDNSEQEFSDNNPRLSYQYNFAIITDMNGNATSIPTSTIKKIITDNED